MCARTWSVEPGHKQCALHTWKYFFSLTTWNTLFQLFYFALNGIQSWTVHVQRNEFVFYMWMILIPSLLSGLADLELLCNCCCYFFLFLFQVICVCFFLLLFHINSILSHRSIAFVLVLFSCFFFSMHETSFCWFTHQHKV